jgi:hypothetical protein
VTPKEFAKYVARDRYCLHCGETEAISPNHRLNRGMGGSKKRNHPANIVVLCSMFNGAIESDGPAATLARAHGWKLASWEDATFVPVFDFPAGKWWRLDDVFGRVEVSGDERPF